MTGPAGVSGVVEWSSDLEVWTTLGTFTLPESGAVAVAAPGGVADSPRFYRARWDQ